MGKIRIDRRGHTRKGYFRKVRGRGRKTLVKRTRVKRAVYLTKDRGEKGRTPKRKQWAKKTIPPKVHKFKGYSINLPVSKRQRIVRGEVRSRSKYGAARYDPLTKIQEGALSVKRTLQRKSNINPSKKAKKVFKQDIKHIERKFKV